MNASNRRSIHNAIRIIEIIDAKVETINSSPYTYTAFFSIGKLSF